MNGILLPLADLSLRRKVALALTLVFLASLSVLLLVFVPFLAQQRQRMLDQDRRLLATLRRSYERELIYDLLSRDRESLAAHLVDLASQEDLVWVRVESGDLDLGASADPSVVSRLLGPEADPFVGRPGVVMLVDREGEADTGVHRGDVGGVGESVVGILSGSQTNVRLLAPGTDSVDRHVVPHVGVVTPRPRRRGVGPLAQCLGGLPQQFGAHGSLLTSHCRPRSARMASWNATPAPAMAQAAIPADTSSPAAERWSRRAWRARALSFAVMAVTTTHIRSRGSSSRAHPRSASPRRTGPRSSGRSIHMPGRACRGSHPRAASGA